MLITKTINYFQYSLLKNIENVIYSFNPSIISFFHAVLSLEGFMIITKRPIRTKNKTYGKNKRNHENWVNPALHTEFKTNVQKAM